MSFKRREQAADDRLCERSGQFIRHLGVPYCELYDRGYTSLGGTTDTHPNPALRASTTMEGEGEKYRPAYELVEDGEERLGRDR